MIAHTQHKPTLARRSLIKGMAGAVMAGVLAVSPVMAYAQVGGNDMAIAQQIANHFSQVKTMSGEFVQFGPNGEQTGGKFQLSRPGKIIFNYDGSNGYQVVSDGTSVVINNKKMRTADLYSLSQTPLKLLLDERIDLSGDKVRKVTQEADLTTIQLADRSVFGNSTITMMFDPKSYELKQWTIRDAQGKDTTVMIFNVQPGVAIADSTFAINYNQVHQMNQRKSNR